mmetsp:Transcript_123633/g.196040  ORF Transcript_123633/g.196040 Transcript_123633/m.196040 type:complete len:93 (+) Transcript_123633:543-821(+)
MWWIASCGTASEPWAMSMVLLESGVENIIANVVYQVALPAVGGNHKVGILADQVDFDVTSMVALVVKCSNADVPPSIVFLKQIHMDQQVSDA